MLARRRPPPCNGSGARRQNETIGAAGHATRTRAKLDAASRPSDRDDKKGRGMSWQYLVVQIIGLVGTVFFFLSFQCKANRDLFRVQLVSYTLYTTHLLLLGAVTGAASYLVNICRSLCLGSRWKPAHSWAMCGLLCAAQAAALAFTWDGWLSILPVAANVAATIGGYTHSPQKVRLANMLVNSPLWIAYDVAVGSWAGILDEAVSEASMAISIVRYGWSGLAEASESEVDTENEAADAATR